MDHYRYHKEDIPNTRADIISDTVEVYPKQFNMPQMSSIYAMFHSAQDLIYTLHNPAPASPLVKLGN